MSAMSRIEPMAWHVARDQPRSTNPFATRWVRPGAIPFHFTDGLDSAAIVERLRDNGWRGAIAGPHGSGKSTLLATLIPLIESAGFQVRAISLHDAERRLPSGFLPVGWHALNPRRAWLSAPSPFLVVDGFEQLGWWPRRSLLAASKRNEGGLLVTVHRTRAAGGLPVLYSAKPALKTVQYLVDHHLPAHGGLIQPADVASGFEDAQGNVREALFALYDLFEHRRRAVERN